jgi:hypothetical protein
MTVFPALWQRKSFAENAATPEGFNKKERLAAPFPI